MHIRFNHCIGYPIVEEGGDQVLGTISGVLIEPDTGKIEGFFVHTAGLLGNETLLCSTIDIVRWGTRVYVNSRESLAPPEDRIRLQTLLNDPRTVLGQRIQTESGTRLGRCKDVQFNTSSMHIEWIFPRKWFRWGVALPVSDIIEIRPDTIVVRDLFAKDAVQVEEELSAPAIPEATVAHS